MKPCALVKPHNWATMLAFCLVGITGIFLQLPCRAFTSPPPQCHCCRRKLAQRWESTPLHASLQDENDRRQIDGRANHWNHKQIRREDRIAELGRILDTARTSAEESEYQGLQRQQQRFEETYDVNAFDDLHIAFKEEHNLAFSALARYCFDSSRNDGDSTLLTPKVFYLEGPDGGTTQTLQNIGDIAIDDCFVANRHGSTCDILSEKYPDLNVIHASATDALINTGAAPGSNNSSTSFSGIDFCAYYFDGCGGYVPQITDMMEAAFSHYASSEDALNQHPRRMVVGFSLLGDTRNMVEKDMMVTRFLAKLARSRKMRTRHVLDEPELYGIDPNIRKTQGNTLTNWILIGSE